MFIDFKDDPEIYVFSKLKYVVIELWQVCVYHQQSLSLDVSGKGDMAVPVIDFSELHGENRSKTMNLLHQACEKWGCFQILISKHLLYEDGVLLQMCDAGHRHVRIHSILGTFTSETRLFQASKRSHLKRNRAIGNEIWDSWFMPMVKQARSIYHHVKQMTVLQNGCNLVRLSQILHFAKKLHPDIDKDI
ncbi:hypothetical protein ACFE04_030692 [Oxalis oulophora]